MGGHTQRPWTPTKRRGPIAAEYQSPGPACVSLPTSIGPGSKAARAPAFSFGSRHNNKSDSPGPGPGQYNVTGLSAKGRDSPPASTLHGRPKEMKNDQTPAPGDYNPEKSEKIVHDHSPMYTFGHKTQLEKPSDTPAPGDYCPEKSVKVVHDHSPMYSFGHKTQMEKPSDTPAPGDYSPEKSEKVVHDHSPMYSFGHKTQMAKPSDTPAPNVYNIPPALGNTKEGNKKAAPAFTISGRQKEFTDDRILTPGPGAYNDSSPEHYKTRRSPSYSISARYQIPSDSTQKPGPGAHCPEKVQTDESPAHSFGIRHSPYIGMLRAHAQKPPS